MASGRVGCRRHGLWRRRRAAAAVATTIDPTVGLDGFVVGVVDAGIRPCALELGPGGFPWVTMGGSAGALSVSSASAGEVWRIDPAGNEIVAPSPTEEDPLVFYIPDEGEWTAACRQMVAAGFDEVTAHNPYRDQHGQTFQDPDGYRVVPAKRSWD